MVLKIKLVAMSHEISLDSLNQGGNYESRPENKDTEFFNMYKNFIYKSDTVNELPVHNFIFQHSRRHCPNIY